MLLIQVPVSIIEVIKSTHTLLRTTKGYSHTVVKSRTIAEWCSAVYIVMLSQTSISQKRRDTHLHTHESCGTYSNEISKPLTGLEVQSRVQRISAGVFVSTSVAFTEVYVGFVEGLVLFCPLRLCDRGNFIMQIDVSPLMSMPSGFCLTHNNTHISSVACAPSHINISRASCVCLTHTCMPRHSRKHA